jgi:hypothetical protein
MGNHSCAGESRVQRAAQAVRPCRQDQWLVAQFGQGHGDMARLVVLPRTDQEQVFGHQRLDLPEPAARSAGIRLWTRIEQNGQIDFTRIEHRGQMPRQTLDHVQAHIGVARSHGLHERQAQHGRSGGCQTHTHRARQSGLLGCAHGLGGVAQGELSLTEEGCARFCWDHTPRRALQQARAQFALQATDLLTQCRLHEVKVKRGATHGAQLHDTHKIAELSKFQAVVSVVAITHRDGGNHRMR